MRDLSLPIADALMRAGVLLDGRYRLDARVRRSATATIHLATHRNGSSAWLKLPVSAADAPLLAIEGRIANAIGSPLIVRDDGTTPEGVPYLVLDPPDGESMAALRARGRKGTRLSLARAMTAGDALVRAVASIHAVGYTTSGLADEDVLVYANGDVALLELHALLEATPAGVTADVKSVLRMLSGLITDGADTGSVPAVALVMGTLAAAYPDVDALQAAWRAAAPEPIALPSRSRPGSLADIAKPPSVAAHDTPVSLTIGDDTPRKAEDSVIGYLRSGGEPPIPPPSRPQDRALMVDPFSKITEMPRILQATSRRESDARGSRRPIMVGALIAVPLIALLGIAALLASPSSPSSPSSATGPAAAVEATTIVTDAPLTAVTAITEVTAPSGSAETPADDLEMNTLLRSEGAPPGRDVFLDGKVIGKTPLETSVPCGPHALQMVTGAPKQAVDLPCGGQRTVRYDAKGRWSLK